MEGLTLRIMFSQEDKNETLSLEFIKDTTEYEVFDINDHQVKLRVEKI